MSLPFVPWAMKRLPCVWSYFTRECRCFQWWEGVRKTLILALSLPGKGEGLENPSAESDHRARLEPAATLSHPRKGAEIEKPPAESEFTHRGTTQAPSLPVSKTSTFLPFTSPYLTPKHPRHTSLLPRNSSPYRWSNLCRSSITSGGMGRASAAYLASTSLIQPSASSESFDS